VTEVFTYMISELQAGRDCVLVTVVMNKGSAPGGKGAHMLVGARRRIAGTIGGGNIEFAAEKRAMQLIELKRCDMVDYPLHTDVQAHIGMVCGGDVTVHFQYQQADSANILFARKVLSSIEARERKYLNLYAEGRSMTLTDLPQKDAYSLSLPVRERAIIFGGGHCGAALASVLDMVGFRVTVMDNRPELLIHERFPSAESLICGDYMRISDYIDVTEDDYAVVMTNAHTFDFVLLEQLLRRAMVYVGVIGSRRKKEMVESRLRESGICEKTIRTVHTPIGLEINAVTPEEIAVSIAAEMIMIRAESRRKNSNEANVCPMHMPDA